jgi:hypothetical protein
MSKQEPDWLQENIEKQLTEIEILKSIYSNPNEFLIEDQQALLEAEFYATNKTNNSNLSLPRSLGFIIKFSADIASEPKHQAINDDYNQVNRIQTYNIIDSILYYKISHQDSRFKYAH